MGQNRILLGLPEHILSVIVDGAICRVMVEGTGLGPSPQLGTPETIAGILVGLTNRGPFGKQCAGDIGHSARGSNLVHAAVDSKLYSRDVA
jgi:hypothetical protein